jgi:histidinol phosphatase-like PHP family hydrolase
LAFWGSKQRAKRLAHPKRVAENLLSNSDIAELLAVAAETAKMPLQKALRRASRKALMWEDEASTMVAQGRSLQELPAVGTSLERIINRWIQLKSNETNGEGISGEGSELDNAAGNPPEIRKGFLTLTEARAVLAKHDGLRVNGDLQMHTRWSDGSGSVEDMARAAAERGYEFIAITDHTKGLKIAGGIDEGQLAQQSREIEEVNATLQAEGVKTRVLRSAELNLDPRGNGDMDSAALRRLDVVLGCFHSALRKKEDQTDRYLAALRNPDIQILGHPRGRIYNFRLGLSADWARVFDSAAELDKAVEIDGYPDRQDLSPDLLRLAKKARCRISLGTDAHDPMQLRFMEYSLASAMKAGIKRDRILNFMSREELVEWVGKVRDQDSARVA